MGKLTISMAIFKCYFVCSPEGQQQNFFRFSGAAICESLLLELAGRTVVLGRPATGVHLGCWGAMGGMIPCEMREVPSGSLW